MGSGFSWGAAIAGLLGGSDLSEEDAASAMTEIMEGTATPAQIAGFLVALRAKGETVDEIVGLVRTMRAYSKHVGASGDVLDTCGTGGDRAGTFNVSTAAALVCAGAGAKVAKHGNRAASSRCGSADVLEALGVRIDLPPNGVSACLEATGAAFCFAPIFHPAMRHAAGPRRELGIATVFNFLGPLTNPAGATRQALGVSDRRMLHPMVEALYRLGSERVIGFHGHGGLDELATSGPSEVLELREDEVRSWSLDPRELGFEPPPAGALQGGSAEENASLLERVLAGDPGPRRDIVVLNAAAGLVASGLSTDMAAGVASAARSIDTGAAAKVLDDLVRFSSSWPG